MRPLDLVFAFALACGLTACGSVNDGGSPVEIVQRTPLALTVQAQGLMKSAKATRLSVPGRNWTNQQLVWMAPDGSTVKAGDVVARFSPAQGELELSKAMLDIERNLLARAAKDDEFAAGVGRIDVDLADVGSQLAIAQRYAGADLGMFARNEILDAIQDEMFLGEKRGTLRWQRDQSEHRGAAELAVLDSQRATFDLAAKSRREDMDSLELRAPHDGVLVLETNWSGEKPKLGGNIWAGETFASLPDTSALELEIFIPQIEAQGVRPGIAVDMAPVGKPAQQRRSELFWVATAAVVRSRQSPVKYLTMKATVPAAALTEHGWVPGQAFEVTLHLLDSPRAVSVPNLAVHSRSGETFVYVRDGGKAVKRNVELGVRGPARSEVVSGLSPGDAVLLTPETAAEHGA